MGSTVLVAEEQGTGNQEQADLTQFLSSAFTTGTLTCVTSGCQEQQPWMMSPCAVHSDEWYLCGSSWTRAKAP